MNLLRSPPRLPPHADHTSLLHSVVIVRELVRIVAEEFHVSGKKILGPRRKMKYVIPRQIVSFIAYEETGIPVDQIAYALNYSDHTAVLHGVKKIEARLRGMDHEHPCLFPARVERCVVQLRKAFENETEISIQGAGR